MSRRAVAALAVAALLGVAAPAAADGRRRVGPCGLLERREITAALGQPAGRGQDSLGPNFCQWELAATTDRARGQVNTVLERGKAARRDYALGAQVAAGDLEPVAGLGRKAFYTPATGTVFVLADRSTLLYVQANVYGTDATRITTGVEDALVTLATAAEARVREGPRVPSGP